MVNGGRKRLIAAAEALCHHKRNDMTEDKKKGGSIQCDKRCHANIRHDYRGNKWLLLDPTVNQQRKIVQNKAYSFLSNI